MKYVLLVIFLASCSLMVRFPDNPIEESVEAYVEAETGIKMDISGSTPDPDFSPSAGS